MAPTLSLRTRFVLLSLLMVGVPGGVSVAIVLGVRGIEQDADRLLEETRESGLSNRLMVRVESLQAALAGGAQSGGEAALRPFAEQQVAETRRLLEEIEAVPSEDDPSRLEHQRAERGLLATIGDALDAAEAWLAGERGVAAADVQARLERARTFATVLADETWHESQLADADVERRARTLRGELYVALASVALACGAALYLVFRTVLVRIHALRRGAERLRGGDLEHRITVGGRDEIGELGHAFNALAAEVRRSHGELEHKIETRTRELVHAARLADVGVLAAGMAHEVNTPLASIASCGEGLLRRLEAGTLDPARERDYLETIVSEAWRTRDITRRLLDLARPAPSERACVDVPALFRQAERLTGRLLEARAQGLSLELAEPLPTIEGDAGELLQVLINLILNARDASPSGGRIALRARAAGEGQEWQVEDRGAGIAPEDLERVFDPFFTTKGPKAGTGLGLSLVAAIVDRHGGTIHAERVEAGGTRFTLRLPGAREAAA